MIVLLKKPKYCWQQILGNRSLSPSRQSQPKRLDMAESSVLLFGQRNSNFKHQDTKERVNPSENGRHATR